MMRKKMNYPGLIFLTLAAILTLLPGGPALAAQNQAAIDKVRLDFNDAFNAGNSSAMARLIDRDGVWMPPGETALVGKEAIVARYADYFGRMRSTFELKPGEIRLSGKLAFLSGTFNRTDTPMGGGEAKPVSGHYLLVLKKQPDGSWRIIRDIWNEATKP